MRPNQIDAELKEEDQKEVLDMIIAFTKKLHFLQPLTLEEKALLPKMDDKIQDFVGKGLQIAAQNPDFLPRYFKQLLLERDVALCQSLQPINLALILEAIFQHVVARSVTAKPNS